MEVITERFKPGDVVRAVDGSYSMGIVNGEYRHVTGVESRDIPYKVLAVDCILPKDDYPERYPIVNDILLRSVDGTIILFTYTGFCRHYKCPKCGR